MADNPHESKESSSHVNLVHSLSENFSLEQTLLQQPQSKLSTWETVKLAFRYTWGESRKTKVTFVTSVALGLVAAYCDILSPSIFGAFTSELSSFSKGAYHVLSAAKYLSIASLLSFVASSADDIARTVFLRNSQDASKKIALQCIRKLQKTDSPVLRQHGPSEISDVVTSNIGAVSSFMETVVLDVLPLAARLLFAGVQLTRDGGSAVSTFFFASLLLNCAFIAVYGLYRRKFATKAMEADSTMLGVLTGAVNRYDIIQQWNTADYEYENCKESYELWEQVRKKEIFSLNSMNIISMFLYSVGRLSTAMFALHLTGRKSPQTSIALLTYIWTLYDTLEVELTDGMDSYRDLLINLHQIKLLNVILQLSEQPDGALEGVRLESLELQNCTFGFADSEPLLVNASAEFQKGTISYIIGRTGSGKGILARLIIRDVQAASGRIICNGAYGLDTVAKKVIGNDILYCRFADEAVFGTLYETLTYGVTPPPSEEQLVDVLKHIGLFEIVSSIGSFDVTIGESGIAVSTGEIVCLLFTRAFLRDSTFVIFDDLFESLDKQLKLTLYRVLNEMKKTRTIIILARSRHHKVLQVDQSYEIKDRTLTRICLSPADTSDEEYG